MISSTFTRFFVLSFICMMVAVPTLWLLSNQTFQTAYAESQPTPDDLLAPVTFQQDAQIDEPVIRVAGLSLAIEETPIELINEAARSATDTDDRILRAKGLVELQKFEEALTELDSVQAIDKNDYTVQFLQARILSWAGKHYQAEQKFRALSQAYPQNPDVTVSYAYLNLYQSKYTQAENLFSQVLKKHPDYADAQTGLNRARDAKAQ